ncbi:hypothetical protein [Haloarchaeobius sp. DYHT-AS-18]|uniref:hypothetical protein n=1 Tax=Haloarchaeobius sp. DYHT-AS-18 TaxID=3446117 RepID=UPI003EBD585A
MAAGIQASIFGETDHSDVATIDTHARILRPLLNIPTAVTEEIKLHVDEDGLRSKFVDPANVALGQFHVTPSAFDHYEVETESTVGLPVGKLAALASRARMRRSDPDPIDLDVDQRRVLVTTEREYVDTTVRQTDDLQNIDPASVRDEPDEPQVKRDWRAELDTAAFADVVSSLDDMADTVRVFEEDGTLVFGGVGDGDSEFASVADFGHVAEAIHDDASTGAETWLHLSYLSDFATAIKKAKFDTVTFRWGESIPARLDFERHIEDDGDEVVAYGGHFTVAPRIRKEGEHE